MLTVSSLIEFLLNLLRDEEAQAEFAKHPQEMLARHGLDGVCGQDVRDVVPMVADSQGVHVRQEAVHVSGSAPPQDAVQEISNVQHNYEVDKTVDVDKEYNQYDITYVDDSVDVTYIDNDTILIKGEKIHIEDSFNEKTDISVINDSYNQDNDGVDNKGGVIKDSGVAGNDMKDSFNEETTKSATDSFNQSDDDVVKNVNNDQSNDDVVKNVNNDQSDDDTAPKSSNDPDGVDVDVQDTADAPSASTSQASAETEPPVPDDLSAEEGFDELSAETEEVPA